MKSSMSLVCFANLLDNLPSFFLHSFSMAYPLSFSEKLHTRQRSSHSLLCVGLDPDFSKLPEHIKAANLPLSEKIYTFNKAIIDATAEYVSCFKPQSAFYEGMGEQGISALFQTMQYLKQTYPEIPVILDAKRGDIGSTNAGYVSFAFEHLKVDAVTVHPYLGKEAMQPFLDQKEKGIFVLVKTSNSGSGEFQDLKINDTPLYQYIAQQVTTVWNTHKNVSIVVGATYPEELVAVRDMVGEDIIFLIPGLGAQGGKVQDIIKGLNKQKSGGILSASRSVLYASAGEDFAQKAGEEAKKLRDEINQYR